VEFVNEENVNVEPSFDVESEIEEDDVLETEKSDETPVVAPDVPETEIVQEI